MTQSNYSTAARNFNQTPVGGGTSAEWFQHVTPATPAPAVAEAMDRALASTKRVTENEVQGETRIRPNPFPDHTRDRRWAAPVSDLPPLVRPERRMATLYALQEWEGHVVEIGSDEFVAQLVDLTAGHSHESEEATIPLAEISERDASHMVIGSIFRWVIGYERSPEGTRRRVSQIVFRDLPRMTERDYSDGKAWAHRISVAISP